MILTPPPPHLPLVGLYLNRMTERTEHLSLVAVGTTLESIIAYEKSLRAPEPYQDGRWCKIYLAGSPLEWYNGPDCYDLDPASLSYQLRGFHTIKSLDDYLAFYRKAYEEEVLGKVVA
jgi:hypothetical protein